MALLMKLALFAVILAIAFVGIKKFAAGGWCHSTARLEGKTVIITGANTGIGRETALDLAGRGARIIMACRSFERANPAKDYVVKEAGVKADQVQVMLLDLSSMESIRKFVDEFKKKESRLDILINNAGVMWPPESKTRDGFELTFGTNHLGHFLLTNLLLDMLKASAPSRVVTVSSMGHAHSSMNWDDLMYTKGYSAIHTYAQSKLSNVLFTRELGRRLKGTGVTTYSLHPGAIRTDLGRHLSLANIPYLNDLLWAAVYPFTKSSTEGAQTQICCAVDEALASETGKYYSDCAEKEPTVGPTPDEDAVRLWDISEKLVGLK